MKISDYLTKEEIARFTAKSDFHAWRLFLANWLSIAAIFAVVGAFPNPLTIALAVILCLDMPVGQVAAVRSDARGGSSHPVQNPMA